MAAVVDHGNIVYAIAGLKSQANQPISCAWLPREAAVRASRYFVPDGISSMRWRCAPGPHQPGLNKRTGRAADTFDTRNRLDAVRIAAGSDEKTRTLLFGR